MTSRSKKLLTELGPVWWPLPSQCWQIVFQSQLPQHKHLQKSDFNRDEKPKSKSRVLILLSLSVRISRLCERPRHLIFIKLSLLLWIHWWRKVESSHGSLVKCDDDSARAYSCRSYFVCKSSELHYNQRRNTHTYIYICVQVSALDAALCRLDMKLLDEPLLSQSGWKQRQQVYSAY